MLDTTRAPFVLRPGTDSFLVSWEIVTCFDALAAMPDRVSNAAQAAIRSLGLAADLPLARVLRTLAAEMDAGVGDGRANPYHNTQHYCEVMLSVLYLSALQGMSQAARARLVVAALAHDFHHDGRSSIGTPFRLERLAAQAVRSYLEDAGVSSEEQHRIQTLILATETTVGVPFARTCFRQGKQPGSRLQAPAIEPKLAVLAQDYELAREAVLLAEADLLPSVGLTVAYGELSQTKLSKEWERPMTAADKLFFLERVFGDFTLEKFFSPNVQRLKDAMREKTR